MKINRLFNPNVKIAITRLMQEKLPKDASFKLKRIIVSMDAEMTKYDGLRNSLIEEFSTKNEAGKTKTDDKGTVEFTPENRAEFNKKEIELLEMDVMIPSVKASELGDFSISAADLIALDGILKE